MADAGGDGGGDWLDRLRTTAEVDDADAAAVDHEAGRGDEPGLDDGAPLEPDELGPLEPGEAPIPLGAAGAGDAGDAGDISPGATAAEPADPGALPPRPPLRWPRDVPDPPALPRLRVLVAGHGDPADELLAGLLRVAGHAAAVTVGPAHAADAVTLDPPHVAVCDLGGESETAGELVTHLRERADGVPLVTVTDPPGAAAPEHAGPPGVARALERPVHVHELLAALSDATGGGAGGPVA